MALGVARRGALVVPARVVLGSPAGVEAQAGDRSCTSAGVGVGRDPGTRAWLAPGHEAGRVERLARAGRPSRARRTSSPSSRSPCRRSWRARPRRRRACRGSRCPPGSSPAPRGARRRAPGRCRRAAAEPSPRAPPTAAAGAAAGVWTIVPDSTWRRRTRASLRGMRPSTRRRDLRSHDLTRRIVAMPYSPSTVVRSPTRVRKSCRTRTSRPFRPGRRSRAPKVEPAASAEAGTAGRAAPMASMATANDRRVTTGGSFLSVAYGVSCRARAESVRYAA